MFSFKLLVLVLVHPLVFLFSFFFASDALQFALKISFQHYDNHGNGNLNKVVEGKFVAFKSPREKV